MTDPQAQSNDESQHNATPSDEVSRRVFNRLSMAAFSGLVAGSMVGCNGEEGGGGGMGGGGDHGGAGGAAGHGGGGHGAEGDTTDGEGGEGGGEPFDLATAEKHACRGLNNCENKGAGGMNACAGQGTCSTFPEHDCHGQNACRGQGGCGEDAAQNACEGQGGCRIPMPPGPMWDTARANFEAAMEAAGKEFGPAPELN